jgi:hypothetical protein
MENEPESREVLLPYLDAYYARIGADDSTRDSVANEMQRQRRDARAVEQHRGSISWSDRFLPHALDDASLQALRDTLLQAGNVKQAWLARKDLGGATSVPHYALLVKWRGMVFSENSALQKVVDVVSLPGTFIVFSAANQRRVARKVRKASGTPVYHHR